MAREYEQELELNKSLAFSFTVPSPANKKFTLDLQPGSSVMIRLDPSWKFRFFLQWGSLLLYLSNPLSSTGSLTSSTTAVDLFTSEIATELLKQFFLISSKAWGYKNTADNLISLVEDIQPMIKEVLYSAWSCQHTARLNSVCWLKS